MRGARHDALVPRPSAAPRLPASAAAPPAHARVAAWSHARRFDLSALGERHIFPCTLAAGDVTATRCALQEELGAAEWTLPGHIVADVVVECGVEPQMLRIEILTVED